MQKNTQKNTQRRKNTGKAVPAFLKSLKRSVRKFRNSRSFYIILVLVMIYLTGVIFFSNAFPNGTVINNVDVSGYNPKGALTKIKSTMEYQTMEITFGSGYKNETVSVVTMGAVFNEEKASSQISQIQSINKWLWPVMIFRTQNEYTIHPYDYDDDILAKTIDRFSVTHNDGEEPVNASISYDDETERYVIVEEKNGTNVDTDELSSEIENYFDTNTETCDMSDSSIYERPEISSDDKAVKKILKFANENLNSKITYTISDDSDEEDTQIQLTPSEMCGWITESSLKSGKISESELKEHIRNFINNELAVKYDTDSTVHSYLSRGSIKYIKGGDYDSNIDVSAETDSIYFDLVNGISETREPICENDKNTENIIRISGRYIVIDTEDSMLYYYSGNEEKASCEITITKKNKKTAVNEGVYTLSKADDADELFDDVSEKITSEADPDTIGINEKWAEILNDIIEDDIPLIVS